MINYYINRHINNHNLKPPFKFDVQSHDYVLEHSTNINVLQPMGTSVPISADLNDDLIIIAQQDGFFKVLKNSDLSLVYGFKAHDSIINDLKIRPIYTHQVLTSSTDCRNYLWNIETQQKLITFDKLESKSAIRSLSFFDSNFFASGTKNGSILLWDARLVKPTYVINNAHPNDKIYSHKNGLKSFGSKNKVITGLVFNYLKYLYSCCPNDNYIRIFDLRFNKNENSHSSEHLVGVNKLKYSGQSDNSEGFTSLTLDDKFNLYAASTDNRLYSYNYQTLIGSKCDVNSIKCFEGASITNYTKIQVLQELNLLISGSSDAEVCLWQIDKSKNGFVNYPSMILPHVLEEVSIVLCNNLNYEIVSCDDANNTYKWIINSKLNNSNLKKYKHGRISETYKQKEDKPFDLNNNYLLNKPRKRFLSGNSSDLFCGTNFEVEDQKRPFKRSRSVIEKLENKE